MFGSSTTPLFGTSSQSSSPPQPQAQTSGMQPPATFTYGFSAAPLSGTSSGAPVFGSPFQPQPKLSFPPSIDTSQNPKQFEEPQTKPSLCSPSSQPSGFSFGSTQPPTFGIPSTGLENIELSDDLKAELLASFVSTAESSHVEIVFSFDTTGSMAKCLGEVRKKVSETCTKLMKDIPNIRIGIIAHGDYCDDHSNTRVIEMRDFCDKHDLEKLCQFVETVGVTGGGDSPEAYELALQIARKKFSWTNGWSKALVIIGDDVPHPPSYTTEKVNWKDEVSALAEMGVKIYGIRAMNNAYAIPFYEELSERTGTVSIHFNNFKLIVDMFLAICYREASPEKLHLFEQEVKSEGKMTEELTNIFQTLAKPNPEKKTREATEQKFKCQDPWYMISNDHGTPCFKFDAITQRFVSNNNFFG